MAMNCVPLLLPLLSPRLSVIFALPCFLAIVGFALPCTGAYKEAITTDAGAESRGKRRAMIPCQRAPHNFSTTTIALLRPLIPGPPGHAHARGPRIPVAIPQQPGPPVPGPPVFGPPAPCVFLEGMPFGYGLVSKDRIAGYLLNGEYNLVNDLYSKQPALVNGKPLYLIGSQVYEQLTWIFFNSHSELI